jgi:TP901-1 family phage major tail protein
MAAQKGSALLLKATLSGSLTTLAGLRSTSMTINGEMVDVTTKDSNPLVAGGADKAREILEGGGIRSMSISASGVFTDSALENDIRISAQKGQIREYKLVFGDGDDITGNFLITSYERAGEFNGEETYSMTLESSGQVTHTSA